MTQHQNIAQPEASGGGRPEVSVYWVPSCSSCLKAKEFVADQGFSYEYVNVVENPEALDDIMARGFRGAPVVRWGDRYVNAQSLDDLAAFFGKTRTDKRLSKDELIARWSEMQDQAQRVIEAFDPDALNVERLSGPHPNIKELAEHTFQVVEAFLRQVEDDSVDARAIYTTPDRSMKTRADLLAYVHRIRQDYRDWLAGGGPDAMPAKLNTHYGVQPSEVVLERGVWHMTQHARQLDHLTVDLGGALSIPTALYEGLPLPKSIFT